MPEMTESQPGHPKFRDPKVFRDDVPQPHKFLSDEPFSVEVRARNHLAFPWHEGQTTFGSGIVLTPRT